MKSKNKVEHPMYRDQTLRIVNRYGILHAMFVSAAAMAGLVSCVPGDDGGFAGGEPVDESPVMPPGEDVMPPETDPGAPGDEDEPPYVPGQLLVRFKSGTDPAVAQAVHEQQGARVLYGYRVPSNLYLVELPADASMDAAMAAYRADRRVLYAQPNVRYRLNDRFPNDPWFPYSQWPLHQPYQELFIDVDIDAPEAWDLTTGSHDVILGVIDTGIAYDHEDLIANLFWNPGEIPDNGVDDDGNGFVDDVHGIDAIAHSGDPRDDQYHGTFVSGIIAARGNNGIGVAGVMWDAQIVSCKAFDYYGYASEAAILTCMDYFLGLKTRAENPVDIVATNNSWSTFPPLVPPDYSWYWPYPPSWSFSQALFDAIDAHRRADMLFVAAAGNDGTSNDYHPAYPASYELDNVISVTASQYYYGTVNGNFGRHSVDVAAPGTSIYSTFPAGYGNDSWWNPQGGTSWAAAHVTGLIGLLAADDPSRSAAALKNLVLAGGDRTPHADEDDDPFYPHDGYGRTLSDRRINAFRSLRCENQVVSGRFAPSSHEVHLAIGEPLTLGVLNIECAEPLPGPQSVTVVETGEVIELVDEAGNGHFKGTFRSFDSGWYTLEFSMGDTVYVIVSANYDPARVIDFEYRDIQGIGQPLDWWEWGFPLPFPIQFGAWQYDFVELSPASGILSFSGVPWTWPPPPLPIPEDPWSSTETVVAPLWMDMFQVENSSRSYAVLGEAPNRELVIDWTNMYAPPAGGDVSFQVVFFENSRKILFSYADVEVENPAYRNGAGASVGLQVSRRMGRQFSLFQPSLHDEMTLLWIMGTPIALAGEDLLVAAGEEVVLDAGNSREVVGAITSYAWTQTLGAAVSIDGADQALARFTAPQGAGTLSFELAVTDEDGDTGTDTVDVIVNPRPVADAGRDVALANHLSGTLDGSGSFDPEGAIIGYAWRQIGGEAVALAGAQTAIATFTAPAQPQPLVFELTVRDEYGFEDQDTVTIDVFHNDPPVADAGEARMLRPGDVATLDGSGSHDPDGAISGYAWEVTLCMTMAGPCVIDLVDANTATPVFEVPGAAGAIQFRLTVTDNAGATSSDTVMMLAFFQEPRAVIAPASCATSGATLALDGSASADDDGVIVAHYWEQLAGAPVDIASPDVPVLELAVPSSQEPLVFALTVTDDDGLSSTAAIAIPVHAPPVAVATASAAFAHEGEIVTLDGSASQGATSHAWTQTGGPAAELSNAGAAVASFVAPAAEQPHQVATFTLTARNACGAMTVDTASVILKGR
jgi:serine protease